MQQAFDFAADDLAFIRRALTQAFGSLAGPERRAPIWRLVRSLIGAQTYDSIAEPALERLMRRWPEPRALAAAPPAEVLSIIADVNHAERKAGQLVAALRQIGQERDGHDLGFLRDWPVRDALDWLERLPGVGPKVAAATLNASTLAMPVFIVDSHVHRVLLRFGFIGSRASAEDGRDAVTAAAGALGGDALLELFAQMKRLGQVHCRSFAAHCGACPLAARCRRQVALGAPPPRRFPLPPAARRAYASAIPRGTARSG